VYTKIIVGSEVYTSLEGSGKQVRRQARRVGEKAMSCKDSFDPWEEEPTMPFWLGLYRSSIAGKRSNVVAAFQTVQ
jgi:hypothetical protein